MLETKPGPGAADVSRLLAGAAKTMRKTPYCWLTTTTNVGAPRARPMGRVLNDPGEGRVDNPVPHRRPLA
jgi:hypothetical protein